MAGKYQAYPEYKDSGTQWLGEVPVSWEGIRLKWVFSEKTKTANPALPAGSISFGSVIFKNEENLSPDTKASYQEVLAGEFLINPLNMNFDLKSLRTALSEVDVVVSTGYIVLNCLDFLNNRYVRWLLQEFDVAHMKTLGSGVRQTIGFTDIGNCFAFLPSSVEQDQIANFLDHETAKIDTLIEEQQSLIRLLKEKRQAVISHAVTKGLPSITGADTPMKDSGVEWLGEVPEHWELTRLKYECCSIVDCLHSTPAYSTDGAFPAIRTADITAGFLDVDNARRVNEEVYNERNIRLVPHTDDIIYSREGERFGIAALVPSEAKVCLGQRVMLFRTKHTPAYLMWALNSNSTYKQAQQDCIGSTSPHVNVETIKNFNLAWPPFEERIQIANYLNKETEKFSQLEDIAVQKIDILQERRTALISAAVTGKIDVRNCVAPAYPSACETRASMPEYQQQPEAAHE